MKAFAIPNGEFVHLFSRCRPPPGWPLKIAVANSGGPDSTCLLFLVQRMLSLAPADEQGRLPQSVESLSIDHGLQASSSDMSRRCQTVAESMGVRHTTATIPWSCDPFPPLPAPGEAFENLARHARYHLLFHAMTRIGAQTIALGHHADDQVETALMRIAKGTTELGVGGMRRCRRWGMGLGREEGSLGWAGSEGMHRWIVRPLVSISKDRLLATCEENKLDYVLDPTNFQPEVTLRNAVREMIHRRTPHASEEEPRTSSRTSLAKSIAEGLEKVRKGSEAFGLNVTAGRSALRVAVQHFSDRVDEVEWLADSHLKEVLLPSPVGTLLLASQDLPRITDDAVRRTMILRILRYVSFHPWGSMRADGYRRRKCLSNVIHRLWHSHPSTTGVAKFNSRAGVLWWPTYVQPSGEIVSVEEARPHHDQSNFGWLASRMPPFRYASSRLATQADTLTINVTRTLLDSTPRTPASVLYDCRFVVRFNLAKAPPDLARQLKDGGKVLIAPHTKWYWPQVWLHRKEREDPVVLASLDTHCPRDWIEIEWMRTLN